MQCSAVQYTCTTSRIQREISQFILKNCFRNANLLSSISSVIPKEAGEKSAHRLSALVLNTLTSVLSYPGRFEVFGTRVRLTESPHDPCASMKSHREKEEPEYEVAKHEFWYLSQEAQLWEEAGLSLVNGTSRKRRRLFYQRPLWAPYIK